jgi:UDP-N-acetylbacillosamine N-acetyltransferase
MDITEQIAIYGKSGHGKVIADIAKALGYKEIIWVDDDTTKEGTYTFLVYLEFYHNVPMIIAIGDNATREAVMQKMIAQKISFVTLIHPSAQVSESVQIGQGSVVMANAVINADAQIGEGVIINSGAIIEHECNIENYVHISPRVALAGNVQVGQSSHVGIGASVIQGVKIGCNVTVGAGAVVLNDVKSYTKVVGVPAKEIT